MKSTNGRPAGPKRMNDSKSVSYKDSDSSLSELEELVTPPLKKTKMSPLKSSISAKKPQMKLKPSVAMMSVRSEYSPWIDLRNTGHKASTYR
jgi:hypothetical protein